MSALNSFGYLKPIPTLLDLQMELLKNGSLEVLVLLCCITFFYVDWKEINVPNFDGVAYKKKTFNREDYKAIIQQELPRLFLNGLVWDIIVVLYNSNSLLFILLENL